MADTTAATKPSIKGNAVYKSFAKFWSFSLSHFSYFFIWAVFAGYFAAWLQDVAGIDAGQAGIIFSLCAGLSLVYQPVFGMISDRLLFRKTLFIIIAGVAILVGPYFAFCFMPLVSVNAFLASLVTGIFMSFILNGGVSVIEQYIQRASLANRFAFAHSRIGGSIAGAVASLIAGRLLLWQDMAIWWACSISACVLLVLLIFTDKVDLNNAAAAAGVSSDKFTKEDVFHVFKMKNFWFLALFYMGAAAIYDVFDQQFLNYFKTLFPTSDEGTLVFANMTTVQMIIEIVLMLPMPIIIKKIGARNGLLIYGCITFIRILGTALIPSWQVLLALRLLAGFEMPLILVSIMVYISDTFDLKVFATVYALASNFAKQVSVFIFSAVAGVMYDDAGFQNTYLFLSIIVGAITVVSFFGLGRKKEMIPPS